MKYRYGNRTEINEQARKQEALEADINAFAAWIDGLLNDIDDEGSTKSLRVYADKRLVEEGCSQTEIRQSRQTWLENWVRRLEENHGAAEARAEIKEEQDEDSAPHRREMARLEKAHAVATEQLDKLLNETPREERRARARGTKKATPTKAAGRSRRVSA